MYQHPRYKKDTKSYEWNLSTIVDQSFDFLLESREATWEWVSKSESTLLAYIAGVLDAEGSVGIVSNNGGPSIQVLFYNTRLDLLNFIRLGLKSLGYEPTSPYLDKKKGTSTSKYKIVRRKDYWRVSLGWFEQVQSLLRRLPIRHREKASRKELALDIVQRQAWVNIGQRLIALRHAIRSERDNFVFEAERVYEQTHAG